MSETRLPLSHLSDAELDHVGAAGATLNIVGLFVALQANAALQTSFNFLARGTGNQLVVQSNTASIG